MRPRSAVAVAVAVMAILAVVSVGSVTSVTGAGSDRAQGEVHAERSRQSRSARPGAQSPPACRPASLPQRAQQVLVVGLPGVTDADDPAVEAMLGDGVGGVFISGANVVGPEQVRDLVRGLRARQDAPLVVMTDEEAGRVSSFGELIGRIPSARALAADHDPEAVRALAEQVGAALAGYGVDVALAPVADLDDGPARGVIGDRSFSAEPDAAADYAVAFARGLADGGVAPTAKHFPGHGRSRADSHAELAVVEARLDDLARTDLVPFAAQIDAGVAVVMTGHVAYGVIDPDLPASLAPGAYDLLRDMGFGGVAITDSLGMGAVNLRWGFAEAAVMAIGAGADAVLATDGAQAAVMRDALVAAVRSGRIPESRLDEAVARMLALAGAGASTLVCAADVAVPGRCCLHGRPCGPDAPRVARRPSAGHPPEEPQQPQQPSAVSRHPRGGAEPAGLHPGGSLGRCRGDQRVGRHGLLGQQRIRLGALR